MKRSISLPHELSTRIDKAAAAGETTPSAWIADAAAKKLKLEEGLAGVAEWENLYGPLTPEEIEQGRQEVGSLLRRVRDQRESAPRTA